MSDLCCGSFPLNDHLDMCLQNGSVFCIWIRASYLSDLGFGLVTGETSGVMSGDIVELLVVWYCLAQLLVLKAGPSV